jgi:site-specific recombinase XerD
VRFGAAPDDPALVRGFFESPWAVPKLYRAAPLSETGTNQVVFMDDRRCLKQAAGLPERFTDVWMNKLERELHARKYSPKTIKSYIHYNKAFCRMIEKEPREIVPDDFKEYLAHLDKTLDLSAASVNLAISALKFFYTWVLEKDFSWDQCRRPRHDKRLPSVLSGAELTRMLACEKNPKHRLLLMLAYSSGLRVSEVVALKKSSIDAARRSIFIRAGKGRKDRYTLLSDRAALFFGDYCALYAIDEWLFPGIPQDKHLSIRSAQNVFNKAMEKAGIKKQLSIHCLRHSFATHLLENGTDIKYIQELLGHASIRTTERYTHVARRHVLRIQSPLDKLSLDDPPE